VLATIALTGLLLAGCSSTDEAETRTEDANAAVCLSLAGLKASIQELVDGVDGSTPMTVSQAQETLGQVKAAYGTVATEVERLGQDVDETVLTASQQFTAAEMQMQKGLSNLDGEASLTQVAQEQRSAVEQLESSYQQLTTSLECSDASQ
jgi:hypothetical protein